MRDRVSLCQMGKTSACLRSDEKKQVEGGGMKIIGEKPKEINTMKFLISKQMLSKSTMF